MTKGDKIKIISGIYSGKEGTILDEFSLYGGTSTYKVDLGGDWCYVNEEQLEPLTGEWTTIKPSRNAEGCECGSWVVGSPKHSHYCRLFSNN